MNLTEINLYLSAFSDTVNILVIIAVFTAVFICSGIITYRIRMKQFHLNEKDSQEQDGSNTEEYNEK